MSSDSTSLSCFLLIDFLVNNFKDKPRFSDVALAILRLLNTPRDMAREHLTLSSFSFRFYAMSFIVGRIASNASYSSFLHMFSKITCSRACHLCGVVFCIKSDTVEAYFDASWGKAIRVMLSAFLLLLSDRTSI